MKRSRLAVLAGLISLASCGYPRIAPKTLASFQKAKCTYAAVLIENQYKLDLVVYAIPTSAGRSRGHRLGEATAHLDRLLCVSKRQLTPEGDLIIEIDPVGSNEYSNIILRTLREGDIWRVTVSPMLDMSLLPMGNTKEDAKNPN